MATTHTVQEAQAIRERILNNGREVYDHVRTDAINPGDPNSRVRVLARRRDNHLVEDEL